MSWECRLHAASPWLTSLRSILAALSISARNDSSSVLMLNPTLASGNLRIRSTSLRTRSDFVWMLNRTPLPLNCSSSALVRQYISSWGLYGSVTEPKNSSFPAYLSGFLISGQYFTSKNFPQGSGWFCKPLHKAGITVSASIQAGIICSNITALNTMASFSCSFMLSRPEYNPICISQHLEGHTSGGMDTRNRCSPHWCRRF